MPIIEYDEYIINITLKYFLFNYNQNQIVTFAKVNKTYICTYLSINMKR